MTEMCLVCNCGIISKLQHPKGIHIMLQYVLEYEKKQDQILCSACFDDLKIAFSFKRKFHKSRRLRLKQLRSNRDAAEFEHNYYMQRHEKLSIYTQTPNVQEMKPKTDVEDQLNFFTIVNKTKGIKNAVRNLIDPLNLGDIAKDKSRAEDNNGAISTNKTLKPSSKVQIEVQDKLEDNEFTDVEYLEDNENTEEIFYGVEYLDPVENENLVDLPDEGNDKENNNQHEEMVENRKIHLKDRARYDVSSKITKTQCVFCFLTLGSLEELVDHKKDHQEEKYPYRCPDSVCNARFKFCYTRERHLIVHRETNLGIYARVRPEKAPWLCPDCGRVFTLKEIFDSHLKSHNRKQHFECKYCFKSFATKTNLQMHWRIHTKGSPFECHECGRRFISCARLEIHKRIHSGVKPFQCEVCKAAFITSSGLIKHWRVNSHFRGAIKSSPDLDLNNK